ncbi:MAG TPA: folate-binding protein [Stellaceae bacterium]|nr:folate-binding protein [Stellaceae bacterium]
MPAAQFTLLQDRGILAVTGDDRASFLQGLVSNDTSKLGGGALYAALLTAQGKYLHDFIMVERDGAIWLDTEAARLPDLKRRLSIYKLRAKVAIDERPELAVAAVFGGSLPDIAFPDPRLAELGGRVVLPREQIRATLAGLGLAEADFAAYDSLRLGLGVPDGSRDLVVDKSILLESGFDELNGVDWQKGCYIGQELTARTKYRGLIKKRLFPVHIDGAAPQPGAILTLDGKEAGEMRSSRGNQGLALLRLETYARELGADSATVRATTPGWMRIETAD